MFANYRLLTCWSRLSLSYRGAAIVTIPALCLLATLGTWLWSRAEGLEIKEKIELRQEQIANTRELLIVMLNAETGVRGYLISGDPDFLEPDKAAQKSLPIALANLNKLIGTDPKQLAQLDSIQSRIQSLQKLMAALKTVYSAPAQSILLRQGKREMDALREEINATQAIDQVALNRERDNLSDLQSLIQS
ncbi:MAG: CHASE3 domain-containing protein, partial [Chamaesiphon sp.]|nr:CHASE3 domain-containing protein [Chamaesiphon sp.]